MAPKIISSMFLLSGLFCLFAAILTFQSARHLSKNGIRVTGRVVRVDFEAGRNEDESGYYYPVFEYVVGEQSHTETLAIGSIPSSYSVGNVAELLVDPENPISFVTTDFFSLWGAPLMLSIAGVILTTGCTWALFALFTSSAD